MLMPIQNTNYIINAQTHPLDDKKYKILQANDNLEINKYTVKNYRTVDYTKNPLYRFPYHHKLYDNQNITEGLGPGMNPNLDSMLTQSEFSTFPDDRLVEEVTFQRHVHILPDCVTVPEYMTNKFLVATTVPIRPQARYNAEFDIAGVCTKHYQRFSDEYYRKFVPQSNKYRLPSKYYRF